MGCPRLSMEGRAMLQEWAPSPLPFGNGNGKKEIQGLSMHIQQARSWDDAILLVSAQAPTRVVAKLLGVF